LSASVIERASDIEVNASRYNTLGNRPNKKSMFLCYSGMETAHCIKVKSTRPQI